ncbi:hypothetical protein C2G38_2155273 [Gigaspora rosea]|uniref:BACK domain-containing protein n=1 Tax=Gigaspora rosea TaxID=44941 RepID=A0A397W5W8_9GLOM|nr:hypothetical protein C2G38_2155273 [Gigaspora rosea]
MQVYAMSSIFIQLFLIENNASWLRLNFSRIFKVSFEVNNFNYLQHFCINIVAKYPNIVFDSDEFITLAENALASILKLDNLQMNEGLIWDHVIRWGNAQNPSLIPNSKQWSDADFLVIILEPNLWEDIEKKFMIPDQTINSNILPLYNESKLDSMLNMGTKLYIRGETYFMMGKYEEAISDLNELNNKLKFKPEMLWEALSDLIKLLGINPNNTEFLLCRGEIYRRDNEALADLNKLNGLLQIDQNDVLRLSDRGTAYYYINLSHMEQYEEALAELTNSDLASEAKAYIDMLFILGLRGIT